MWRGIARWFVVLVLTLDAAAAFLFVAGGVLETGAAVPAPVAESVAAAKAPKPDPAPVLPSPAIVAPATAAPETAAAAAPQAPAETIPGAVNPDVKSVSAAKPAPAPVTIAKGSPAKSEAFTRLLRAYENMEPESAAKALAGLAVRDKEAVVQLLLGWKPRTSGAILDALTQINASLAADLSYEVWKRDSA